MSLKLKVFGPAFGEVDASPFCMKAMCLLNMANVEWTALPGSDSRKTPAGKLPVLLDGDKVIHDSDRIRTHLEKEYGANFEKGLSDVQRAQSRALIRMVEEHLYFCLIYERWVRDDNWAELRETFFSQLPPVLRSVIPTIVRRSVVASVKGQGIGKHSYDDMVERAVLDIEAIEVLITDKPCLFGDNVVAADVSVVSVLSAIAASPSETKLRDRVLHSEKLMSYINSVKESVCPKDNFCKD